MCKSRFKGFLAMGLLAAMAIGSFGGVAMAQAGKPAMKMCTGRSDGVYFFAAQQVKKFNQQMDITPIETEGSLQNIADLIDNKCDAAFVQNDVLKNYAMKDARAVSSVERASALYKEYVHLICNKASGISNISDLKDTSVVAIGRAGSGSQQTWQGLVDANSKKYGKIRVDERDGNRALTSVADGTDVTCMIYVGGLGSKLIKETAKTYADRIVLATTDDDAFTSVKDAKGKPLYSYETIPAGTYAIMPSGMIWGTKKVSTVAVDSVMIVNVDWINKNSKAYDQFLNGLAHAVPAIKERAEPK